MKYIQIVLCLILSTSAFSQKPIQLKFCPLALVDDVSFPTIQAGVEYRLSNTMSWYNELGVKYRESYINKTDTTFINPRGFKLKTELRYYFPATKQRRLKNAYLAVNAFYTNDHHNTQVEYVVDSLKEATDVFAVKKNVLGLNLVFGQQKMLSRRFGWDFYCGVGFRYRMIKTENQEFNKDYYSIITPVDVNIPSLKEEIDANGGNTFAPNITAGIRLIYVLK
ncbi:DUF3575 domain-containing protein [Pinibacter aurantiacus]|uniref:DUF3575 domain-containing protein n=1 Tax=Pinibacter aurantiacus TaxID=2851599 RepID=A0A9E2W505_9BACT|nr:DUF3575 domain-containing protein [Pinibacter aurantiacus]MBV4358399.1 DUF3575 domain-containing protein [Pinibacter aurantiacus]